MWIESSNVPADRYLCGGRYPTQHVRLDPNRIFRTRTHVHIPGRFGGTFPVQAFSIQKVVIKTLRVCLKHTFSANATSDACWTYIREDRCKGDAPSPAFHRQHRLQNANSTIELSAKSALKSTFFLMFFSLRKPMSHSRKLAHRTGHVTRVRKTPGFVPHGQPPPEHWQQEGNAGPSEEAGRPLKNSPWLKQPAETKRERNFMRRRL